MDMFSSNKISGGYTVKHSESYWLTNPYFITFHKLISHLLATLSEAFPECTGTASMNNLHGMFISNNQNIKEQLIKCWYNELGAYSADFMDPEKGLLYVCAKLKEKHGDSPIKDLNIMTILSNMNSLSSLCHPSTLLQLLQLESKWRDPGLNHESKMYLLQYFVHMNACATLFHIVPEPLTAKFYAMTEQFRNNKDRNILAFCQKFQPEIMDAVRSGSVTQDDLLCFTQNMNEFITAVACMTFGADQVSPNDTNTKTESMPTGNMQLSVNNNSTASTKMDNASTKMDNASNASSGSADMMDSVKDACKSFSQQYSTNDVHKIIANEQLPIMIKSFAKQLNIPDSIINSEKTEKIICAIQSLPPDAISTFMSAISSGNPAAVMNANFLALIVSALEQNGVGIQDLLSSVNAENITMLIAAMKDSPMVKSNPSAQAMLAKLETMDTSSIEAMLSFGGFGGAPERPSLFDGGDDDSVF